VQKWFANFVTALGEAQCAPELPALAPPAAAAALAYRPERPAVGLN